MKTLLGFILLVLTLDFLIYSLFFKSILAACLVALICATVLVLSIRRYQQRHQPLDGWRLGPALEITNPDKPVKTQAMIQRASLQLGTLVLGAPGSGKTESFLLGNLYALHTHTPQAGMAIFDGKGDIDLYKKAAAMGVKPDYFFSSELPGTDSINLFEGDSADVVDRLTHILIGQNENTSYYADVQRAVLTRVVPLLLSLNTPVNLRDLYVVLSVENAGAELLRITKKTIDPVSYSLAEQWFSVKHAQRIKEIAGLLNRLFIFVNGAQTDRLNCYQPTIKIAEVVRDNKTIFFHLPLTEYARDLGIALVEMFAVEAKKRQLSGTEQLSMFPIVMDDWGAFFYDGFGAFSARCRSAAMPLSFAFQSMSQVKKISQTFADELDDNLATKIIYRIQGEDTGQFALRLLGEYDTYNVSTSELGQRDGTSISMGRKPRLEMRDLKELAAGEAYVSTLLSTQSQHVSTITNPLYKVQFPLPPIKDWQQHPLPAVRLHTPGQGLGFWERYMNPKVFEALHAAANAAAEKEVQIL